MSPRTPVADDVTWLRVACGRCGRTLGRLRWPTNPAGQSNMSDIDVHDWLYRYDDRRNTGLRGPIKQTTDRVTIETPTSETARLDITCRCGHRGRLRLANIPHHLTGDTITVP